MLRFGGRDDEGRRVIGMILSKENVERLKGGDPIFFDAASVGVEGVAVVLHVTDTPNKDLLSMVKQVEGSGGEVRPIEDVLEERAAIRNAGGDPDASCDN